MASRFQFTGPTFVFFLLRSLTQFSFPVVWNSSPSINAVLERLIIATLAAEEEALARRIDTGSNPRLLVILENFEGWERGADWNDLDFHISHGDKFPRSPSLPSHVGRLPRLVLQERESVARR
jgi:hypothetical protein